MSQELKEAVDRFEALVRTLTADTTEGFKAVEQRLEGVDHRLEGLEQRGDDLLETMRQIQISQVSMTSALTQAVTQLALSRDLDKRVERLEAAVFPPKH